MRGDCALYVPRQIARSARIVCRAEPVTEIVARESTNERAAPWTIQAARTTPRATTAAAPTRASLHIPLLIVVRSFPVAAPVENRDVGESPRGGCVPEPSIRRLAAVKTHDACRNRIPCCCLRLSARTRGTPAPCGPPSTALGPGGHFRIAAARDAGAH